MRGILIWETEARLRRVGGSGDLPAAPHSRFLHLSLSAAVHVVLQPPRSSSAALARPWALELEHTGNGVDGWRGLN
jgi:hypothetical protein